MAANPTRVGATKRAADDVTEDNVEELSGIAVLEDLRADLADSPDTKPVSLVVPLRDKYQFLFDTNIDYDELRAWIKRAKGRAKKDEPHMLHLSYIVLSNKCVGMTFKGKPALGSDDRPLTFTHPELAQLLKVPVGGANAVIKKMYGRDGHVILTMKRIMDEAGYSDEIDLDEGDVGPLES